jgi:predicted ABC-type ATPase
MDRPLFVLLAGPNGSGKSTLAALINLDGMAEKIDPDRMIGADGSILPPLAAGREVIARTDAHVVAGRSFLLETTLSGNRELRLVSRLRSAGYCIDLYFVCLSSAELNIQRVRLRVGKGGHDVPAEDIVRRYDRSLHNLREILPLTDRSVLFDNSGAGHRPVARFETGILQWQAAEPPKWLSVIIGPAQSTP